jgi:hypothetical protein
VAVEQGYFGKRDCQKKQFIFGSNPNAFERRYGEIKNDPFAFLPDITIN